MSEPTSDDREPDDPTIDLAIALTRATVCSPCTWSFLAVGATHIVLVLAARGSCIRIEKFDRDPAPTPRHLDLILSLVRVPQLKRLVRLYLPGRVADDVDYAGSIRDVGFALIDALKRHGCLDQRWFQTLVMEFPYRFVDIARVAALHGFPVFLPDGT